MVGMGASNDCVVFNVGGPLLEYCLKGKVEEGRRDFSQTCGSFVPVLRECS